MKNLTINQLLLLLDIYRGTDTQLNIGTRLQDLIELTRLKLLHDNNESYKEGLKLSEKGLNLITHIEQSIIKFLEHN